ncbi:MAG TPA: hypothetical protein VH560_15205, partial [Polyangia bacterium]|nr:hypothetical protein [Polyangia bacterium]
MKRALVPLGLAIALASTTARAQTADGGAPDANAPDATPPAPRDASADAPPTFEQPRALTSTDVPYPAGAP